MVNIEKTEFYTYNSEVWYRNGDTNQRLTEQSVEFIDALDSFISEFYPDAYSALEIEFRSIKDIRLKKYRIAVRFVKCNFGNIDNILDIDSVKRCNFERVGCPLRGECRMENIVCNPRFNSNISPSEMRVLRLLYDGKKVSEIADILYLSQFTVKNHIHNALARLSLHNVSEFIIYAKNNGLFSKDI